MNAGDELKVAALEAEFAAEEERRLKAERELREAQQRIAATDAEMARLQAELSTRIRDSAQREHERRKMEQHVSDLEKSLENARKERDEAVTLWNGAKAAKRAAVQILGGGEGENLKDVAERAAAELDRLKPSGQVAEDEALLVGALEHINPKAGLLGFEADAVDAAARRLAAKAQGYEAAMAKAAELERQLEASMSPPSALAELIMVRAERDAAVADNAALHAKLEEVWLKVPVQHLEGLGVASVLRASQSGAALLEEHRKALVRARNEGLEEAARWHEERAQKAREEARREPGQRKEKWHQEREWSATVDEHRAKELRAMKTTGAPESWPTTAYAKQAVAELVSLLEPFAAGEEGNRNVVGRVMRLLGRLKRLETDAKHLSDGLRATHHAIGMGCASDALAHISVLLQEHGH
jgi:hypothetical protein